MTETVKYFTTNPNGIQYETDGAAGADLYITGNHTIQQGEVHVLDTGIWVEIPEGYVGEVTMRSSYAKRGLFIPNAPGLIDSDYRGEIKIIVSNITKTPIEIVDGHRVAQITWRKVDQLRMERVSRVADLSKTKRGAGGLGSTGR